MVAMDDDRLVSPRLQLGQPQRNFPHRNQPRPVDPRNREFIQLPTVEQQNGWMQYLRFRLQDGFFKTHDVMLERSVHEPKPFMPRLRKREGGFRRPPIIISYMKRH